MKPASLFSSVSCFAIFALGSSAAAAVPANPAAPKVCTGVSESCSEGRAARSREGVLLDTHLVYKNASRDVDLKVKTIFDLKKNEWIRAATHKSGLVLFAFVQTLDKEQVRISLKLVDTSSGAEEVLSQPTITGLLGSKASLAQALDDGSNGLKLEMVPSRVRFELE